MVKFRIVLAMLLIRASVAQQCPHHAFPPQPSPLTGVSGPSGSEITNRVSKRVFCQLRPEGRNRRGETRLRGPEVLGPLRGLGIRPLVSVIRGLGKPLARGPLEPRKGSQGLGGGSSEASERGVRFQRSGKTRWATQRPLRGPVFPDAP